MRMKISFEFPAIGDSRLQKIVEGEQKTLIYSFLAIFIDNFVQSEWDRLINDLSASTSTDDWSESVSTQLLNIIASRHLYQELNILSHGTDFEALRTAIVSLPRGLQIELIEGLLSAFEDKLDTITLTTNDMANAFEKYGVKSEAAGGILIGNEDLTRDVIDQARTQLPRYVNFITSDDELRQAKEKVSQYLNAEPSKNVNQDLSDNLMGCITQSWQQNLLPRRSLEDIVRRQQLNCPQFSQRPIGRVAARVRDYISLETKIAATSAKTQENLFKDLWKLFGEAVVTYLRDQDLIKENGYSLKDEVEDNILQDTLQQFRSHLSESIINQITEKIIAFRDGLKEWVVLCPLPDVKVETADQLPELNKVKFLNAGEAQDFLDENVNNSPHKREGMPILEFGAKGGALVNGIRAVDATRAAQIGHRILHTTLDWFIFSNPYGKFNNPRLNNIDAFCVEIDAVDVPHLSPVMWSVYSSNHSISDELLLRHPNNVDEQLKIVNDLSALAHKLNTNQPIAKRITKAIYWYRKGQWSEFIEDRLLSYWICLETLLGSEDRSKEIGKIIAYRTGVLVPAKTPVDGIITYEQLRDWTREFVQDVYSLRNQITHGGNFEGPSIERFVDRFGSTVHSAIITVLYSLTSEFPAPECIEELLTWIWDRNPDNNVASPAQP